MKNVLVYIIVLFLVTTAFAQTESNRLRTEAIENIGKGKYGEAIELLNRYISANPQISAGFNLRGVCFEKRGEYEKAVYDFRSALKLDPENNQYQSNLSRTTIEFNKILYNIIAGYKREIAINPLVAKNYLEIGKSYKKLGEWSEAENWYDDYLKREQASSDEVIRYSEILVKTGHISKGEPILKEYTEKYPQDHRLWSRYGYFTMWLGKKKIALAAFETALELRPYFKEAMDGYDLVRGKGYVYTVNDTTTHFNYGISSPKKKKRYAIDRYFSKLKKYPADKETRYLLINELVKKNRFEEAELQIDILARTESSESRFLNTKKEVNLKKYIYYQGKISTLKEKLNRNKGNREALLELVQYYSYKGEYYNAIEVIEQYLEKNRSDDRIRYQQARLYSQIGELESARDEMKEVIINYPQNSEYQLFYGQLLVWLNADPDKAEKSLNFVLDYKPENLDALISLTMLNFQRNNLESAGIYLERGLKIDPVNEDLLNLKESIVIQEEKNEKASAFKLLEIARGYSFRKNCNDAISAYKEYFNHSYSDDYMRKELAEAYICSNNYDEALKIYREVVSDYPEDYELSKQLAKIYFWSGDSISALFAFEELHALNDNDAEVKLFLGDSYLKVGDYEKARSIYEEMLAIAPSSNILQTRMNWIGNEGIYGTSYSSFPVYFSVVPSATFFSDDLDFSYSTQGVKLETGLTEFLTVSFGGYIGVLSSESERLNLNTLHADGVLRFSKVVKGLFGVGITNFENDQSSNIFEAGLVAERENKYRISVSFHSSDAAQVLYSPFLVGLRLRANISKIKGEFKTNNEIILGADLSYITVSDDNKGTKLALRLGKGFDKVFKSGYEYYNYNLNEQKTEYWSPENFEVHSAWFEWNAISESELKFYLNGKVGLVSADNVVVKEFQGILQYYFIRNIVLQTSTSYGNTVRVNSGYNSWSLSISVYWTL